MSLAKQNFATASEEGINNQINMEFTAMYTYTSMAAYFDRDNVALPGLAKFFRDSAEEEREHAQKLIDYQNQRGGRVNLQSIPNPSCEWQSAQNAVEAALQLEKDVNKSLLNLHNISAENGDPQFCDFIETHYLTEQVESIKKISDLVTQLKRVGGDGLGLYLWDRELLHHGTATGN
ncbi:ferritin-like protein [Basidiobolus meristosporus CBS 931.73]|uniref:Ferritin n=1 Tax=Basidiobolus meristosporus CBS 931.73 TaxID=1314790 RepID=A0A1Y1YKB9_9FUNG|nr:ferritin-like protein [Basidiobolus meristosporus CBS 931.73]|eukprot:ORX98470.1 ferritin-like protein [Basidiobolus meristosporus CBS 931.73]